MRKALTVVLIFLNGALFANDYRWDLVSAFSRNNYTAAEQIINQNINSASDQDKRLIVNYAISYSYGETTLRTLQLLQRHNVSPSAFDLYTAINRNQPDAVIQFILSQGVQANGEILLLAMEKQRFNFARHFINAGADVNYHYPLARQDSDGMTSLLYASLHNNFELVQMLVDRGANINIRNKEGSSALTIAQMNGNNQISNYLLEQGALQHNSGPRPNQPNQQNQANQSDQQGGGVGAMMDGSGAAAIEFRPGNYRLTGSNRDLRFSGNLNFGSVRYVLNNRVSNGSYQISGGNLTMIVDGRTFVYKLDSNMSFSGYGEVWQRTGD
ncbi:MAG: ankyrin repeat domain-containing protein [Treponema sp.]|nr:ankyrin repeat domain-containing protein [Treponema sp.]